MIRRTRGRQAAVPALSPAWRWLLMTGGLCPQRVPGWVGQAQAATRTGEWRLGLHTRRRRVVGRVSRRVIAEARAHNFEPFWQTHREPTGEALEQWRAAFLATHRY